MLSINRFYNNETSIFSCLILINRYHFSFFWYLLQPIKQSYQLDILDNWTMCPKPIVQLSKTNFKNMSFGHMFWTKFY